MERFYWSMAAGWEDRHYSRSSSEINISIDPEMGKTISVTVSTDYYTSHTIRGIDDSPKTSEYNLLIYISNADPVIEATSLALLNQLQY